MDFEYLDKNLNELRRRIDRAEEQAGRPSGSVLLLAAVKYAEPDEIEYLHRSLGVCDFGENRVQQFLSHYEAMEGRADIRWHFIGTLQTNKVKYIIDKVSMIHSLDSLKLAAEIDRQAKKRDLVMDVLVEINSGEEASKSGLAPAEVEEFCLALRDFGNIRHRGFMTMAPKCDKKEDYLKYFQQTYAQVLDIWTKTLHNIDSPLISMGMSGSFEEAILCGSDIVRVGRSLFVKEEATLTDVKK